MTASRTVRGVPRRAAVGHGTAAARPRSLPDLQAHLRVEPGDWQGWAAPGLGYVEEARATGNPSLYANADGALDRSLDLHPDGNAAVVPSPSALVVLLGAIALGQTWFGIALVLGYGIGMALTLVGAGLLMVGARTTLDARLRGRNRWTLLVRALPVVTASFVVVAGVGLSARALGQL